MRLRRVRTSTTPVFVLGAGLTGWGWLAARPAQPALASFSARSCELEHQLAIQPTAIVEIFSYSSSRSYLLTSSDYALLWMWRKLDRQVKSLHYYHSYAVHDRIDVSSFPNELSPTCIPPLEIRAKSLLPSKDDDFALIANIKVLFSHILVQTLTFFNVAFSDLIVDHINHRRYKEMSSKSYIVSTSLVYYCLT